VGGSGIAVVPLEGRKNRFPTKVALARGHREHAPCCDLSPFDQDLLVSANFEGFLLVQRIPEGGLKSDLTSFEHRISTGGKVHRAQFHPYVHNVIVASVSRPDGSFIVGFWSLETGELEKEIEFFEGIVEDFSFHSNCKLMATSCKDGKIRIIDVQQNSVVKTFACREAQRDTQVLFASESRLLTIGFGERSRRSFSIWDFAGEGKAQELDYHSFPVSNGSLIPHFDVDNNLFYVAHFGSVSLDVFQLYPQEPYYETLQNLTLNSDIRGMAFTHKTNVDTKKVEIARCLRVNQKTIVPVTWTLPRRRKQFFQDDLYSTTLSPDPIFRAQAFFDWDGDKVEGKQVSLRPPGMELLSNAPEEELTGRQKKYLNHIKEMEAPNDEEKAAEERLSNVLADTADYTTVGNRWDAKPANCSDVDDDEWGSDVSD